MSKEKQIKEMGFIIRENAPLSTISSQDLAEILYESDYRKQSEGEWIDADPNGYLYRFTCSLCGKTKLGKGTPFCPNCGASMKGGGN